MQLTIEDYQQAHKLFISRLGEIQPDLLSVFLFGSMARGEAVPGYSDLDYWIFLRANVLEDLPRFRHVLSVLVSASQEVQAAGIPVYNVCCYFSEHRLEKLPVMLYSNLCSDENSTLVLGEQIRARIQANPAGQRIHQQSTFFALRQQIYHPLTAFLGRKSLTEKEYKQIMMGLQYAKYLPEAICATRDLWPGERAARTIVKELLPGIDFNVLDAVKVFCVNFLTEHASTDQMDSLLNELLALIEAVHSALLFSGPDRG